MTDNSSVGDDIDSVRRYLETFRCERDAALRERDTARMERDAAIREAHTYLLERNEYMTQVSALERNLFVPPGHFYSPVVNVDEVFGKLDYVSRTPIDVSPSIDEHSRMWESLALTFNRLPALTDEPVNRYKADNQSFPLSDAVVLQAMLATFEPKRLIEVGSGYSSAAAMDMILAHNLSTQVTFIEPYPDLVKSLLNDSDWNRCKLISSPVQDVDLQLFGELQSGDFLFIDSTHVLKTESDVHFELFEVLPRLQPGVVVHFHDIFWPWQYPRHWIVDDKRSWNELYAIRAFLSGRNDYRIEFFNHFFWSHGQEHHREACKPFFANSCGSLWLRKLSGQSGEKL